MGTVKSQQLQGESARCRVSRARAVISSLEPKDMRPLWVDVVPTEDLARDLERNSISGWVWEQEEAGVPVWRPSERKMSLLFREVKLVAHSCTTLCDPADCSPPGSSIPRKLGNLPKVSRQEYRSGLPSPSPGDLRDPRDWTNVCSIAGRLYHLSHQRSLLPFVPTRRALLFPSSNRSDVAHPHWGGWST